LIYVRDLPYPRRAKVKEAFKVPAACDQKALEEATERSPGDNNGYSNSEPNFQVPLSIFNSTMLWFDLKETRRPPTIAVA
jgi:hypothetical protein